MNIRELESALHEQNPKKVLAAQLLVANSYAGKESKTLEEIAEEVGIARSTLTLWRQDPLFIKYEEAQSELRLAQYRSLADAQLIRLIKGTSNNGLPSIKALETFYKLQGRLTERSEVVQVAEDARATKPLDDKTIEAELMELRSKLKH